MIELIKKEKHPRLFSIKIAFYSIFFKRFRHLQNKFPQIIKYKAKGAATAFHLSAYSTGNAGDTLLPVVLRDLFNDYIGIKKWKHEHVHKVVSIEDVANYNSADFIVIGGGGLFLKDTNPNPNSGWQWNCDIQKLNNISKPLIAFAIGYNRFRDQDEFEPVFFDHINAFVKKASFVGLRNNGSVNAIQQYIKEPSSKEKIVFQPCMTTLISLIYPNLLDYEKKEDFIAINCAFDRQEKRGLNEKKLIEIALVAKKLSQITKIKYYSHTGTDILALKYLDEQNVAYELVEMTDVKQIIKAYTKPRLVIGMRGHSQMIPFGCLTPILSIISHDKMKWFLDDINHPEFGVDILDPEFKSKLEKTAKNLYYNYKENIEYIKQEQKKLWDTTQKNLKTIKNLVKNEHT